MAARKTANHDLTMVNDYSKMTRMAREPRQTVSISEFKAKCLALLDRVKRTGEPLLVTRRGEPIAEVVRPAPLRQDRWVGSAASTGRIVGDIVEPASALQEWDVSRS